MSEVKVFLNLKGTINLGDYNSMSVDAGAETYVEDTVAGRRKGWEKLGREIRAQIVQQAEALSETTVGGPPPKRRRR